MRKIINKTKLALAFFAMIGQVITMSAQPTIYDISATLPPGRSLIREYSGSDLVVYKYNYFAYIEDNSPYSNVIIHDLGSGLADVAIYDMEILGDVLYFCGADTVSNIGKYGYVSIPELADSTISANLYIEDIPYFSNTGTKIEKALKMDVFKANGDYHIVIIGEYRDPVISANIRCVIDTWCFNPMSTPALWTFEMVMATNAIEYYTDIVVTDNYVVTDAQKYGSDAEYLRFFDKPTLPGYSIFTSPLWNDIYMPNNIPYRYQSHCITHLAGDEIVTATIGIDRAVTGDDGILLSHFDCSTQSLHKQYFIDAASHYDPSWRIIDLKYDIPRQIIYVMTNIEANANGIFNYIIDVPLSVFFIVPSSVDAFLPFTTHPMQSMTPVTPYTDNVVAIGDKINVPTLYQHESGIVSSNSCDSKENLAIYSLPSELYNFRIYIPKDNSNQRIIPTPISTIPSTTLNIQCQ